MFSILFNGLVFWGVFVVVVVVLATLGLCCCAWAVSGSYSPLRCASFSLRWLLLLQSTGSRRLGFRSCGSQALECRLSSCGSRAQLLRSMWDLPGPGLEPVSPAGGSPIRWFIISFYYYFIQTLNFSQFGHQELIHPGFCVFLKCLYYSSNNSLHNIIFLNIIQSRCIFYFLCTSTATSHFFKEFWFLLLENGIQKPIFGHQMCSLLVNVAVQLYSSKKISHCSSVYNIHF